MGDLSMDARNLCARFFGMSAKDTLHSHPPHATLTPHRAAMDELIAAGLVSEQPFNQHGSLLFTGSEAARAVGQSRHIESAREAGWFSKPAVQDPAPLAAGENAEGER